MALIKDFIQTELGVLPIDWDVKSCSEISSPVRGGSPRPAGDPRYFNGAYIPWLTVASLTNIPESQIVVYETNACLTELGSKYSRTLESETVIIANSGATLGVAKILGMKCCANDGIAALLEIDNEVDPYYLVHYINTKTKYLRDVIATGNGQPNLNTRLIGNFKVPLPKTKKEQEIIANALSDADAFIESLEKLISKKWLIKKGVMQKLLAPKKDWKEVTLVELCDNKKEFFDDGDWVESEHITCSGVRLIQTGNVGVGVFLDRSDRKYINESSFQSLKCKSLQVSDLLISRLADPAGRACILPELEDDKVITSVDVTICRPLASKADRHFLVQLFSTDMWLKVVAERSGGTTHKRISRGSLGKLKFKVPTLREQQNTATILTDIDNEIFLIEKKLQKARFLKQGMMQELLTGRIRLI